MLELKSIFKIFYVTTPHFIPQEAKAQKVRVGCKCKCDKCLASLDALKFVQ